VHKRVAESSRTTRGNKGRASAFQKDALQIVRLGERGGVIRWMAGGFKLDEAPTRISRRSPHDLKKFRRRDVRGAGRSNQNSVAPQRLDSIRRQFSVGLNRAGALGLALGQRRRVKDDEVKLLRRVLLQPGEGVGLDRKSVV